MLREADISHATNNLPNATLTPPHGRPSLQAQPLAKALKVPVAEWLRWEDMMKSVALPFGILFAVSLMGNAVADCAWVLWSRVSITTDGSTQTRWELENAFENRAQCMQAQDKELRKMKGDSDKDQSVERVEQTPEEGRLIIYYKPVRAFERTSRTVHHILLRCLPETAEPREKK